MTNLKKPENGAKLDILTARQREFIREETHPYDENKIDWAHLERMSLDDYTLPPRHLFSWETDEKVSVLKLSGKADLSSPLIFKTEAKELQLNNFKAGATYYWAVNNSEIRSFTTEDAVPRFIEAGGVTNVRDAGNWNTKYGCRIKQGLLYRGSEMDIHHTITEDGKRTLCEDLKIKTDLDLRGKEALATPGSPMGEQVRFVLIPIGPYHLFMRNYRKQCLEIFEFLADESNYPIYYHCWGGADRTGTLAFLLGVVLGMSEQDLILDYELTSLSIWGDRSRKSDLFKAFLEELALYKGNNMSEQAHSFLLTCGVTEELMEKIRKIFLER